jgi:hypothetical protein
MSLRGDVSAENYRSRLVSGTAVQLQRQGAPEPPLSAFLCQIAQLRSAFEAFVGAWKALIRLAKGEEQTGEHIQHERRRRLPSALALT